MTHEEFMNYERLRQTFEGREAVYLEKGVLRVRVENIRLSASARIVEAQVVEIPTRGLERTPFHSYWKDRSGRGPLRWSIAAGHYTEFSDTTWDMGYGGWSLDFSPDVVSGLVALAATWSPDDSALSRYEDALALRMARDAHVRPRPVFLD